MPEKVLFVINPGSGNDQCDVELLIETYFKTRPEDSYAIYNLPNTIDKAELKRKIDQSGAKRIVATGGDGTIKLVAENLVHSEKLLGILPYGSANGMAKELGIPMDLSEAIEFSVTCNAKKIHLVEINGEICIHLADLGFNAYLVKKFDGLKIRGMLGYMKATFQALIRHERMQVELTFRNENIRSPAAMVAIANATSYGSGLKINPDGRLDDDLFEVILVKDYSYLEILRVWLSKGRFNPEKVEVFQTNALKIASERAEHFQIDGEYLGKKNTIAARLLPNALNIIAKINDDKNGS